MKGIEKENKKGFTLVELLIVMAIIGILIAIAIIGLGSAQATARNESRQTAVKGLSGLIETYYGDSGGTYPSNVGINLSTTASGYAAGYVQFESPLDGTYFTTGTNLCKNIDAPLKLNNGTFDSADCSSKVSFAVSSGSTINGATTTDTNSETYYFYIPFTSSTPSAGGAATVTVGATSGSPVTGYIIGACLENSGIFAYSSNGSNAPFTTNANSINADSGSVKITCG
jgi:prepilin-type N-terminal cleavage/methylation domain-containing protein